LGINLVVAVTDDDWFEMLRSQPDLNEVNFWAPSAANFRALQSGELFLFKLHAPRNFIVGGGIFAYANTMPCSLSVTDWLVRGPRYWMTMIASAHPNLSNRA
jgi:putative restriction endonuclease